MAATQQPVQRLAVIDIGTNSVKLLVAELRGGTIQPLWEGSEQTRLGAGFYETKMLQPQAIALTAKAVAAFAVRAGEMGADRPRVIATSAARDALNATELTAAVASEAGLRVEIISGDREAVLAFMGVTTDPALASVPLLLMDVGGGSTEFILGQDRKMHFCRSFPLGTVRLLEKMPVDDPPTPEQLNRCRRWIGDYLAGEVLPGLAPALKLLREHNPHHPVALAGTGGTATILARLEAKLDTYDREIIERTELGYAALEGWMARLWGQPLAERRKTVGLPEKRADVILPGAAIYEGVMRAFGFGSLRISTRGLRFAALLDET